MPRVVNPPSQIQVAVNRRFFAAVDTLVAMGAVRSLSGFIIDCGLHPTRYREMRLEYGTAPSGASSRYVAVETEALYHICTDHHVSAAWLLTGRGRMFTKSALQ